LLRGKTIADSVLGIGGGGFMGWLSVTVIVFVALIPFFALRNLNLAIGSGRVWAMVSWADALGARWRRPSRRSAEICLVSRVRRLARRL
jgi:hypothetical protein